MRWPGAIAKIFLLALVFAGIIGLQFAYDLHRPTLPVAAQGGGLPPIMIRMVDLGFHSTVASFLWAATMPEIIDLFRGRSEYFADRAFLNAVDPKLSYPYAFSVITLPAVPTRIMPDALTRAQAIGREGIANADPDWRIPYYMAINYYLELKDLKDATWYFNIAAETPGVPEYAARFAMNFGINQKERDRVRGLWATVYESTNDQATKDRAAAYVARLNMLDYLEAAAKAYKQKFGAYPATPEDLVAKKIIPAVPPDPFGFSFLFHSDGTAAVDSTK
jgi:hypothetical protein